VLGGDLMAKSNHPGFLVWNPFGRAPHYRHMTLDAAQEEAKRLARLNAGERFYVLVPVSMALTERPEAKTFPISALTDPVNPDLAEDDDLPF
jgi:hypothetical protein